MAGFGFGRQRRLLQDQDWKRDEGAAFVASLRVCTKNKDLSRGTSLHDDIVRSGLLEKCSDALVTMYSKCGILAKARELFEMYKSRDVFTWTALIAAYVQKGQAHDALDCYERMELEGILPNAVTFTCILKACGSLKLAAIGGKIHEEIRKQGLLVDDIVLGNALVDMYAKCGVLTKAAQVLKQLPSRDIISWTALIAGYTQHGEASQALSCFEQIKLDDLSPNEFTFMWVLKACGNMKAADKGEKIHDEMAKFRLPGGSIPLGNALMEMYVKCSALVKARQVLEELPKRNAISWSLLIAGYVEQCEAEQAFACFERMRREGLSPNATTYVHLMKACGDMKASGKGEEIYRDIAKEGLLKTQKILGTALVDMFVKCGALTRAQHVLEELPIRDVISWNALIVGYAQWNKGAKVLDCFEHMRHENLAPDVTTFICILKACGSVRDAEKGEQIHNDIRKEGILGNSIVLANALVNMYAKCGALEKAQRVLEELPARDVISWNALIAGYVQEGHSEQALNCLDALKREGLLPNAVTFICILNACGNIGAADKGEKVHDMLALQGLPGDNLVLGNSIVNMYVKCGVLERAQQVLEELPVRDVISWNSLIAGYVELDKGEQALDCYEAMLREGLLPNAATFTCILKACGSLGDVGKGEKVHDEIIKQGLFGANFLLDSAIVDMYAKCGAMAKARRVHEELPRGSVASWSALIMGYALQGQLHQAYICFERMQSKGFFPDSVTYISILKACGSTGAADKGEKIHDIMVKQGLPGTDIVLGNALVDMYCKCGLLARAWGVLEELPVRDDVTWTTLISGYAQQGEGEQALNCFEMMQSEGVSPSAVTFACILKACSSMRDADRGAKIHDKLAKLGMLRNDVTLGHAVVDMYAKCGALVKARRVLEDMPFRDVTCWMSLITGYMEHGQGTQALDSYEVMQYDGLSPDELMLGCILKACGSIGAIDKGEEIHDVITKQGLLRKSISLGNALVDMYAKCGVLVKARHVLEELRALDVISWNALIAGYTQEGEGEQALECFDQMQRKGVSPDAATFTCVFKVCSMTGAAEKGEELREEAEKHGLLRNNIVLGNALVDMYAKCGASSRARQVLEELPTRDVISWNALIAGYAEQREGIQALECFEQMQCEGLLPDAGTLTCALNACSRAGLIDDARALFVGMSTMYGIKPDLEHYTCMVDLFSRIGRLDLAIGVVEGLQAFNNDVWSALLCACRKLGDMDVGRWAFEHAIQVDKCDAAFYIVMADIYAAAGMQGDAANIKAMRTENNAWQK